MLDVMLDGFDDNDGIVDDETDREHETEERERVHREAKEREERERADERYGHGQQWNERRAPSLKKDEYDEDDQHQGFKKRVLDLVHALRDGERGVEARRRIRGPPGSARTASFIVFFAPSAAASAFEPGSW